MASIFFICWIVFAPLLSVISAPKPTVRTSVPSSVTAAAAATSSTPMTSHDAHSGGSACSSSTSTSCERDLGGEGVEGAGVPHKGALLVHCHNLSDALDSVKGQQHADEKLSKTSVINLSDQVTEVHGACAAYVDNIPATGRFRFRSLLNKLEDQAKDLREAGISGAGGQSPQAVTADIHATVRDLVIAIKR